MKKALKGKFKLFLMLAAILVLSCFIFLKPGDVKHNDNVKDSLQVLNEFNDYRKESKATESNPNYIYLSDINYLQGKENSYVGWGEVKLDKKVDGEGLITLIVDGKREAFYKGIGAHATSQLIYDISSYSDTYSVFYTKLGVDASRNGSGNVKFTISASNDLKAWDELFKTGEVTSGVEAKTVKVNVKGYRYLKLYADRNGVDHGDHSVYADARLVKPTYDFNNDFYDKVLDTKEYDDILKSYSYQESVTNHRDIILKREFVSRLGGKRTISNLVRDNKELRDVFDFILEDRDALRLLIECGETNYFSSVMIALAKLYSKNKTILALDGDGYIYKKMMIALAFTYASDRVFSPLAFNTKYGGYDINLKFDLYKELYDNNRFARKEEFKTYNMELMRIVMNNSTSIEEFRWLREYSEIRFPNDLGKRMDPYSYLDYQQPNYNQAKYFAEENRDKYDKKYHLSEFNVKYEVSNEPAKAKTKLWMAMETGGICWNISRLGQDLRKLHGIPSIGTYQPSHEAYFFYEENNNLGRWVIGNNVFGWQQSYSTWYKGNPYRLLLGWNNLPLAAGADENYRPNYSSEYNSTYMLVAQAALNDYKNFETSNYYNMLANSYYDDLEKQLEIYNLALKALKINVYSYNKIIEIYKETNRGAEAWFELSKQAIETFTYYPNVFVDVLKNSKNYLTGEQRVTVNSLSNKALEAASKATNKESLQDADCRAIANFLLGKERVPLASFSFDGENKNEIILDEAYDTYNFKIKYTVDGGTSFKETTEHRIKLTDEEVKKINSKDDIIIVVLGSPEEHRIDIKDGVNINKKQFGVNDLENRFMGNTNALEYSFDNENWYIYDASTRILGNKHVYVRYMAHGIYLKGEASEFDFIDNVLDYNYIPVENITLVSTGTPDQPGEAAINMLDASIYTKWHTKYSLNATNKEFVVSFNTPKDLRKITYEPSNSINGRIRDCEIHIKVSKGGKWIYAGKATNWENDESLKEVILDKAYRVVEVKILPTYTYGEVNKFVSGKRFGFYEDIKTNTITIDNLENLQQKLYYKDKPVTQSITVNYQGNVLEEGKDFRIEYENNNQLGQAKMTIYGVGNYYGKVSYEFMIIKEPLSIWIYVLLGIGGVAVIAIIFGIIKTIKSDKNKGSNSRLPMEEEPKRKASKKKAQEVALEVEASVREAKKEVKPASKTTAKKKVSGDAKPRKKVSTKTEAAGETSKVKPVSKTTAKKEVSSDAKPRKKVSPKTEAASDASKVKPVSKTTAKKEVSSDAKPKKKVSTKTEAVGEASKAKPVSKTTSAATKKASSKKTSAPTK